MKNDLTSNKNNQSQKSQEILELHESINKIQEEIKKINDEISKKSDDLSKLKSDLSLENEIIRKEEELKDLERKANRKPTKQEIQEAKAQWDKGSIGFFEKMGSQDVLKVFTTVTSKHETTNVGKIYLEENLIKNKLDSSDSRTLENMYQAVMDIGKINDKRRNDKGIDGRTLSELKVTDYYMAIAQANANYSHKFERGHVDMFEQSENLAWGPKEIDSALERWWDDEKKIFDYVRGLGKTNVNEINNYIYDNQAEIKEKFGKLAIGHYLNLVDDGWFGLSYKYDNRIMGYAVRDGDYGNVNSMVATELDSDKSYTVEEYQTRFEKYYNNLKDIIEGRKNPYTDESREKIKELKKEIEKLKAEKKIEDQKIANLETEIKNLENQKSGKSNLLNTSKENLSKLNNELSDLEKVENNLTDQIKTTKSKINELEGQIDAYIKDHADDQAAIKEIKGQITDTKANLDAVNNDLEKENQDKSELESQIKSLNDSIANQEKQIKKLSEEKDAKANELAKLREEKASKENTKKELEEKLANLDKKINENQTKLDDLTAKNENAQKDLSDKQDAQKQATAKLNNLKSQNKTYSDLKTKAEEAKKEVEKAKETLDLAKSKKKEAKKSLEDAQNKVQDAKASKKASDKLDPNNFASLSANDKFKENIKDYEDATKALENLDKPLKEAVNKLSESQKDLDEAREAYKKSLARFKVAEADLKAFKKPDDESNDKDDPADIPERDFDHKDSDLEDEKAQNAKLSNLYQAVIRNKILTEAARTLLRIAPEKVSDIKVELKNIIDKSKELTNLAEVELIGFYSLLEKDENSYLVDQKYSNVISINDILYGKYEDFNFNQNDKERSELDKLKQAIIKNKIMIKAAKVLLELAPEKVSSIRPQLLKIIEESNQLVKLGQNILIENGYKIK